MQTSVRYSVMQYPMSNNLRANYNLSILECVIITCLVFIFVCSCLSSSFYPAPSVRMFISKSCHPLILSENQVFYDVEFLDPNMLV